jgi:large subunit ribosomal protein L5
MKDLYEKTIVEDLKKALNQKNRMAVPKITKVNMNIRIGSLVRGGDKNYETVIQNATALTGQKPVVTKARKAISNFKLRIGDPVGIANTIRGPRMYDFISRLVNVILPRIRDFRGISVKGFDGQGNYNLGVKEVTVFPEVNPDNISRNHGVQLTINTTAKNDHEGYLLLKGFGFPFKDKVEPNGETTTITSTN